ncbi:MAG: ATPase P, partial [Dehalococcoidia bacterium]|nr:ATPase P [Dehalococcoidia bacterium]
MVEVDIPGRGTYRLTHLVLDFNGTLALDGHLLEGVAERLKDLALRLEITVATADTFGTARELEERLGLQFLRMKPGSEDAQKLALVERLGKAQTVCMGNGANDVLMLRESALGICIVGGEGASSEAMAASDLV